MIYHHSQLESVQAYDFKHLPQHPHDRDETEDEFKCRYCQIVEVDDEGEWETDDLDEYELKFRKKLIVLCKEIAEMN